MKNRRYLNPWFAVLVITLFSFTLTIVANAEREKPYSTAKAENKADLISIDTLESFGPLERKPVPFFHDAHTDALDKMNKDCTVCHLGEEISGREVLSTKFKRLNDENKEQVMDAYHNNCIACHEELYNIGNQSGPTELCGECHRERPEVISAIQPVSFDKFLHSYHIEINGEDCSTCHHDNRKEGSCRDCHKKNGSNKLISMKTASHLSCIGCHQEISGPAKCSSCHDIDEQEKIDRSGDTPRLTVGQPDAVHLGTATQNKYTKFNPVPFDHKAHEQYQDSCRICHHMGIESCSQTCHTKTGSEKGNMIRAEQAMHQLDSQQSCLGCHEINKKQKECIGCHGLMAIDSSGNSSTCLKCHMEQPKTGTEENITSESMAAMLLESRKIASGTFDDQEIPETVTINKLSSQYSPVEFPHRQIINALVKDIEDNKLAGYFHSEKGTICQACHHNSPVSKTPPNCSSCHGKPFDERNPLRPGLKAAYHQQCMDCHDSMGIDKPESTDCIGCHKEIGVNKLYDF